MFDLDTIGPVISVMIAVFIAFLIIAVIVNITCGRRDCRTIETKLQEASQSAQIKEVCATYENTPFKDVPIKCLQSFDIGTRK